MALKYYASRLVRVGLLAAARKWNSSNPEQSHPRTKNNKILLATLAIALGRTILLNVGLAKGYLFSTKEGELR